MKPHGFDAAAADWNERLASRPMNADDWARLTLGEQASYGARECRTKGAVFKSRVCRDSIEITVSLPSKLALNNLSEDEARWIEGALHRTFEETVHWIITGRQIRATNSR